MPALHLALLRGINVGGKNTISMPSLIALFEAEGCTEVSTYIQSGNVIFNTKPSQLPSLANRLSLAIRLQHGLEVPFILRSREALRRVVSGNPLVAQGSSEDTWHVMFLAGLPDADKVSNLDPKRSAPDTFLIAGMEIYLCLPGGVGRSKLTSAYFDAKLETTSTCRNWRTVTKLLALMDS